MKKTFLCFSLSFALLASALNPLFSADVFAKAKLAKTKITLTVGQKKKITIKGKKKKAKYTFKASNKKVSVNKKGVVTAKKAGKTKITVKEKLKKKTKKIGVVTIIIKSKVSNKKSIASAQPAATNSGNTGEKPTTAPTASATPTLPPTPTGSPKPTATPRPKENPDYSDLPSGFMNKNEANSGTLEEFYYDSTEVSEGETVKRHARVALPKGYTESKKYPVIYMQHGIFGNEYSLTGDNTQYVAWNAMANDDMKDSIVVFANVCANKEGKGTGFSLEHYKAYDNFINDLTKCLMPAINKKYSTLTGRENTAVCGFSMGGRVSLQIGFERPDLFGYIGAFCPAPGLLPYTMNGVTEPGFYTDSTFTLPSEYLNDTYVQITKGFKDDVVKQHPLLYHQTLQKTNTPHVYYETMGGDPSGSGSGNHEKAVYQHGFYNFMKNIFKPNVTVPAGALRKDGVKGTTEEFEYESTAVAEGKTVTRKALVGLPDGYNPKKKYPVVYGLHGYGWGIYNLAQDGATDVVWNGYANDVMDEVIMVFPNICANESGQGNGYSQETYDAYDNCVNDIVKCLMPAINKHYSVKTGRLNTAVWGFSMGGREALNAGFKHPDKFGYIGAFCPAPGVLPYSAEKGIFTEDTFTLPDAYKENTLVMIVKGKNDTTVGNNPILYHKALEKNNVPHIYYETMGGDAVNRGGGGHQNVVYLHGLYNLMKRAFPCK